jgi:hypothetical protein
MLKGHLSFLSLILIFCIPPPDVAAQSRSDRYVIRVFEQADVCRYQIQDHADQDLFHIRPGGTVTIQTKEALWVDVAIQDDSRGTPGTRSRRSVALRSANDGDVITARSSLGRSTEHKVQIQCCVERREQEECPKWTDARPPRTAMGTGDPGLSGLPARGPAAGAVTEPALPPGGPVMRVDEN